MLDKKQSKSKINHCGSYKELGGPRTLSRQGHSTTSKDTAIRTMKHQLSNNTNEVDDEHLFEISDDSDSDKENQGVSPR